MPKNRPVRILKIPENINVLGRETVLLTVRAITMGRNVPRSPKDPEISDTGLRLKVLRLWLLISRNVRRVIIGRKTGIRPALISFLAGETKQAREQDGLSFFDLDVDVENIHHVGWSSK